MNKMINTNNEVFMNLLFAFSSKQECKNNLKINIKSEILDKIKAHRVLHIYLMV